MVDRIESSKDIVQELVESTATHVGRIATIITSAVADVAREIGEIVTDGFEMREAARLAKADEVGDFDDDDITAEFIDDIPDEPTDDNAPAQLTSGHSDLAADTAPVEPHTVVIDADDDHDDDPLDVETAIPDPVTPVSPEVEAEIDSEYDG